MEGTLIKRCRPLRLYSVFLIIVYFSHLSLELQAYSSKRKFCKSAETGKYYLLESRGIKREFPNEETLNYIVHDLACIRGPIAGEENCPERTIAEIPEMSEADLSLYKPVAMHDLHMENQSPDERMRGFTQHAEILEYPWYWNETYFIPGLLNPAMTKWNGNVLCSWRSGFDGSELRFGWMADDYSGIDSSKSMLGLNPRRENVIEKIGFNNIQEDPRLLVMPDNSLVVSYSVYVGNHPHGHFLQSYCVAKIVPASESSTGEDTAEFGRSYLLIHPDGGQDQKNWMPFEYEGGLYFIENLNPLHIVKITGEVNPQDDRQMVVETTTRLKPEDKESHLPWQYWYGNPPRGGTPAILVKGTYLGFFHTLDMFQSPYHLRTYFMGAFSLCPHPPFNVLGTSEVPFLKYDQLYVQAWISEKIDYVVFPLGLILDDDGEHVWLSFGHQDKDAFVIKIEIDGLLSSLEDVPGGHEMCYGVPKPEPEPVRWKEFARAAAEENSPAEEYGYDEPEFDELKTRQLRDDSSERVQMQFETQSNAPSKNGNLRRGL